LKKSDFDLNNLEFRNEKKQEQFQIELQQEYSEFIKDFEEIKRQNFTFDLKFPGYSNYLLSDEWIKKRELVLKRDNYLCQCCLNNKAVQVHHTSYTHVFNEPLFELTSVCINCHEIITNMDRKNEFNKIQH
jgi:hypothetical protein